MGMNLKSPPSAQTAPPPTDVDPMPSSSPMQKKMPFAGTSPSTVFFMTQSPKKFTTMWVGKRTSKIKSYDSSANLMNVSKKITLGYCGQYAFKNNLSFDYDEKTEHAVEDLAHLVSDISKERVAQELNKMMLHPHRAHAMRELEKMGLMKHILPEMLATKGVKQPIEYHQEGGVLQHSLKALHDLPEEWLDLELAWAVFFHDIGKPSTFELKPDRIHFDGHAQVSAQITKKVLQRLKFSKVQISKITWLVDHHMTIGHILQMKRVHQVNLFLHPWFEDLMKLHWCDEHGSIPIDLTMYEEIMKEFHEFKDAKLLEDHFRPMLNGDQIMELTGLKPGPKISELLSLLREAQIEGEVKTKEEAEGFVKSQL